ncbi:MAG: phytanoyl-CoA dioxygenase family protein [Candidatus Poribacteria bacterium]|nr:phytanoyl-CoA dioxygenase family protein [Candidatus Poribacteria bacterium]
MDKVLSQDDLDFFDENGYVILHDAVPQENLDYLIDTLWTFLEKDPNDPDTWYKEPMRGGGMVEIYQHQALWNNRQSPRIHAAYAQLWGTHKLWVSMDRASMKPPINPKYPEYNDRGFLHWDANTDKLPLRFGLQGVLYLADTAENQGGFRCVPGVHKMLTREENPVAPDLKELESVQIPGKAGDFLIWHIGLPHGNGLNTSDKPRLAQYITMSPANESHEEGRQRRISLWRDRLCPGGRAFPGDPRKWEEERGTTAELSPLGKRVLGLETWEDQAAV